MVVAVQWRAHLPRDQKVSDSTPPSAIGKENMNKKESVEGRGKGKMVRAQTV